MTIHALAGLKAPKSILINIPRLISAYYTNQPDVDQPSHRVAFGTSGHRGSSASSSFNENHIYAITQAICCYRKENHISGPLFIGFDTHALSEPAFISAIEVLAANGVEIMMPKDMNYTPTPAISHAILTYNKGRQAGFADGIVITPSHNPPDSGGIKYNPPNGGPADTNITAIIAERANGFLRSGLQGVARVTYQSALQRDNVHWHDYIEHYVGDLANVIDMEAIRSSGLKLAADALGGSGLGYWGRIAERYGLQIDVLNGYADPTFGFMTVDGDGKIRMDCSSPYAMAGLIGLKEKYELAFGNDPDFDRHGIVTKQSGLMNPNHYLAVAIEYLFSSRAHWPQHAAIGKTLVSSSMIDRVAAGLGRQLAEVPVGFKWFVDGLLDSSYGFGGEESAGASFLRTDGTVWTTDKDGMIMCLLAAEMMAKTGRDPGEHYQMLTNRFGQPVYERVDAPATSQQKAVLAGLTPERIKVKTLAGEPITAVLHQAPGNRAPIGGLKVCTQNGWFAARPSGTEDVYKIYAESFSGSDHLRALQAEARQMIDAAFTDEQQ